MAGKSAPEGSPRIFWEEPKGTKLVRTRDGRAFNMWENNQDLLPQERKSKKQISLETGIPYTTLCERLSGRRGGGCRGKIAGGKYQARILDTGKCKWVTVTFQAGNHNRIPA